MFAVVLSTTVFSTALGHPSWGIVVSSTGVVYFSDLETVWKISRDGNLSVFRPGVSGRHVHELSIDEQDNIYGPELIYDSTRQKYLLGVWKMTPDGKQTQLQSPIESFMSGVGVCRDRAGNMYAIEQNNNLREKTVLLKRTPDGRVTTLAGGAYGDADGNGPAARFSSVYAMALGSDGNLYLTDGSDVRRVTQNGVVMTVARDLTARTLEDKPTLFGGNDKILAGVAIDNGGNVYVADAGNRRLLKIAQDGKPRVVYRLDPPYFPTGVFAGSNGDIYVLEFSYTPPGTTDKPRVRKLSTDGQNTIFTTFPPVRTGVTIAPVSHLLRSRFQSIIGSVNARILYFVLLLVGGVTIVTIVVWRKSRRQHI